MPVGMQAFGADGSLQIDVTTRMSRMLGILRIPAGASGSVVVPASGTGKIDWVVLPPFGSRYRPALSVSGDTLSWGPGSSWMPGGPQDCSVLYFRW